MAGAGKLNSNAAATRPSARPVTMHIAFAEIISRLTWSSLGRISIATLRADGRGAARRKLATRQDVPKLVKISSSRMQIEGGRKPNPGSANP